MELEILRSIKNFVSDGIIANKFTDEAYDLLKSKKKGKYIIMRGEHKEYNTEIRELNGLRFKLKNRGCQDVSGPWTMPDRYVIVGLLILTAYIAP